MNPGKPISNQESASRDIEYSREAFDKAQMLGESTQDVLEQFGPDQGIKAAHDRAREVKDALYDEAWDQAIQEDRKREYAVR